MLSGYKTYIFTVIVVLLLIIRANNLFEVPDQAIDTLLALAGGGAIASLRAGALDKKK